MKQKVAKLRIKELLDQRGISILELHEGAGIAYNTALSYARDSSDQVNKRVLASIANFLGVSVQELFEGDSRGNGDL